MLDFKLYRKMSILKYLMIFKLGTKYLLTKFLYYTTKKFQILKTIRKNFFMLKAAKLRIFFT